MDSSNVMELYTAQEKTYLLIQKSLGELFKDIKLCGGTPLARCYLNHRVSYDLDFFLPYGGKLTTIEQRLKETGKFVTEQIFVDKTVYSQLFGYMRISSLDIEVSFIEDRWYNMFPLIQEKMGNIDITTEPIAGLFHRKLRTISGYADSEFPIGGRQTLRDLFDLYVLSKKIKPIPEFISELAVSFPEEAFYNGLANMDWLKVSQEIKSLKTAPEWEDLKKIENLSEGILNEAGMTTCWEEIEEESDDAFRPNF